MTPLLAEALTSEDIAGYLLTGFAALTAIMMHEISHGLVANLLGDSTAKDKGRLTLNPLKHVDIFGLFMLIVAGFGWAKPVPVDTRNLKNPRRDMCFVALAGPVMNFLMAIFSFFILGFLSWIEQPNMMVSVLIQFLLIFAAINTGLGVFNLFPIPPLDGSKVLGIILPEHLYYKLLHYERYGMLLLMALLVFGVLDTPLGFLRNLFMGWFIQIGVWPSNMLYQLIGV